jgi:hypothetical protein
MSMKPIGKALTLAGVALVVSTLAIEYTRSSQLSQSVRGSGEMWNDSERTWEVRKYGYVVGAIGLCLMLCAPAMPRELGTA